MPPQHTSRIRLGLEEERRGVVESVPTSGDHVTWASREHTALTEEKEEKGGKSSCIGVEKYL